MLPRGGVHADSRRKRGAKLCTWEQDLDKLSDGFIGTMSVEQKYAGTRDGVVGRSLAETLTKTKSNGRSLSNGSGGRIGPVARGPSVETALTRVRRSSFQISASKR